MKTGYTAPSEGSSKDNGIGGRLRRSAQASTAIVLVLAMAFGPAGSAGAQVLSPFAQPQQQQQQQYSPLGSPYGTGPSAGAATQQSTQNAAAATGQATSSPFVPTTPSPQRTILDSSGQPVAGERQGLDQNGMVLRQPLFAAARPKPVPNEFQNYVETTLGRPLPRFGESLQTGQAGGIDGLLLGAYSGPADFSPPATAAIPPDYQLNPGDEVVIHLTGSIEGDVQQTIDSNGRIYLQRVGAINLAGVRFGDLQGVIARKVGEQYRNFKVSVSLGQLRGVKVYVTGYAVRPGAYTLNSLSTLVNAAMAAGGPGPGGSFRSIQLRRGGRVVSDFDFYDLLLRGDKSKDVVLQNEDVLFIAPVGQEVAITGSVNAEAIYEAKTGETLADLIRYAGGASSLADDSKLFVSRLSNLDSKGWDRIDFAAAKSSQVQRGDILRITSAADFARPLEKQSIVVKIEGEVAKPGRYYLAPGATVADLLAQAGGLTSRAYLFGSELDRVSVQKQQQAGFDQAIRNLETAVAASPLKLTGIDSASEAQQAARVQIAQQVIRDMKAHKPDGRIVLPLDPEAQTLPGTMVLENDDRILVPPKPATVGVFGWVYQQGSFAFGSAQTIGDYLKLAGGPQRQAEAKDIFVVRANGAVVSKRQHGGRGSFEKQAALPGDVIFVPVRVEQSLWWDRAVQVTQILYQLGLSAAAIKVLQD